ARPRAVVEFLRRAAMDLFVPAHGALGPLLASGDDAEIRGGGVPDDLVVGQGQGGQGAAAELMTRTVASAVSRAQRSALAVRCRPGTATRFDGPGSAVHHFAAL